jgi:hypothetical protein
VPGVSIVGGRASQQDLVDGRFVDRIRYGRRYDEASRKVFEAEPQCCGLVSRVHGSGQQPSARGRQTRHEVFDPIGERDGDHLSWVKPAVPQAGGTTVDLIRASAITHRCPIVGHKNGAWPCVGVDKEISEGVHTSLLMRRRHALESGLAR